MHSPFFCFSISIWLIVVGLQLNFAHRCEAQTTNQSSDSAKEPVNGLKVAPKIDVMMQEKHGDPVAPLLTAHGIVVDEAGDPIEGVDVHVREWPSRRVTESSHEFPDVKFRELTAVNFVVASTKTDAKGKFHFDKVKSRSFRMYKDEPSRWTIVAVAKGKGIAWQKMRTAKLNEQVRIVLEPETKLKGHVFDNDGKPIANVKVYADKIRGLDDRIHNDPRSHSVLELWETKLSPFAITNADGEFEIGGLPPSKRVNLASLHDDYMWKATFAATVDYSMNDLREDTPLQTGDIKVTLRRGRKVHGRVFLKAGGKPASDMRGIVHADKGRWLKLRTDQDGRFESELFESENAIVEIYAPAESNSIKTKVAVSFAEGQFSNQVDVTLIEGAILTGQLKGEDGVPISKATISFSPEKPVKPDLHRVAYYDTTDEDGKFRLLVNPDSVGFLGCSSRFFSAYDMATAVFSKPVDEADATKLDSATRKLRSPVSGETFKDIVVTVKRAAELNGVAVDADGIPVRNAQINLVDGANELSHIGRGYEDVMEKLSVTTDKNGRFKIVGITNGSDPIFRVLHHERQLIGYLHFTNFKDKPDNAKVVLSEATNVRGRVMRDGKAVANQRVYLHLMGPAMEVPTPERRGSRTSFGFETTNSKGQYEFQGVVGEEDFVLTTEPDGSITLRIEGVTAEAGGELSVKDFEF